MTREEFLIKLFEKSGDSVDYYFDALELVPELGIEKELYKKYSGYWVDKGILRGGDKVFDYGFLTLRFNSYGIDYVENNLLQKKQIEKLNIRTQDSMKIFISHSSEDVDLAASLVKLFHSAFSLPKKEIRCTSVPGYKFEPGIDTDEAIKKEVYESSVLIGLITPNSLKSSYVLFELGARWVLDKYLVPTLGNGSTFDDLPTPIKGKNAIKLDLENDLNDLIDSLSENLQLKKERVSSFSEELRLVQEIASKKKLKPTEPEQKISIEEVISSEASKQLIKKKRMEFLRQEDTPVEIAKNEGELFYSLIKDKCDKNSHQGTDLFFRIERTILSPLNWVAKVVSNGGSARIEFYIPFTNSVLGFENNNEFFEDACIIVEDANFNIFQEEKETIQSPFKKYEMIYYFTVDGDEKPKWTDKKRGDFFKGTEEIVDQIFSNFYETTKNSPTKTNTH